MGNNHSHGHNGEFITDVPYKKLTKHTNFSSDQVDLLRKRFCQMYPSYILGGGLTKDEFSKLFGLPPSEITDACFELFDIDNNGVITFKELIATLSICCLGSMDEKLHFLFELWDYEEQGYISKKEMETMIRYVTRLAAQLQDNDNVAIQKLGTSISILTHPKKVLKETINTVKIYPLDRSPKFSFKDRKDMVTMEIDQINILVDKLYEEADTKHDGKITFKMFKEWSKKTPQIINFLSIFDNFLQDSIREKAFGKRLSKITESSSTGSAVPPRTNFLAKDLIKKVTLEELVILQKVGEGGFSNVYLCTHSAFPCFHFALKRIPKEKLVKDKMFRQARSEKKALMKIEHPLILKVYNSFHDVDSVYLLAEFVCGGDLSERLKEKKQFPVSATKFYAAELVLVLEYFRKINFAHRDLKLENILIDSTGHIKVSDFGFSTYLSGEDKVYTCCGTRNYMAPEVIEANETGYDYSCDLWSLGIIIYEMIVGVTPFYDENRKVVFTNILNNKVNFPEECHFDHPTKLFISGVLEKKPSQRLGYDDINELKDHIWFEEIHWEGHLEGDHIVPPYIPILEIEVDDDLKQNGLPKYKVPDNYDKLFTDF